MSNLILITLLIVYLYNMYATQKALKLHREYAKQFTQIETAATTVESKQKAFFPGDKHKHAVLLLHGYPSSTSTYRDFFPILEKEGVPYLAPMLTGLGLTDGHLLPAASRADWIRDALNAYDLLALRAEKVNIVATSVGSLLATEISKQRPVEKALLVVPAFYIGSTHAKLKKILELPIIGSMMKVLLPYKINDLNDEEMKHAERLRYPYHEINSALEVFKLQDEIKISDLMVMNSIHVFIGEHDETVSNRSKDELTAHAKKLNVVFSEHSYPEKHRLFPGDHAPQVFKDIIDALKA